jgi:carotenoid cleavage dioxygenase-like enzyme
MANTWRAGFETQREELSDRRLDVSGAFPAWLDGTLLVNGPGQFDVGGESLQHWFDALAMLRRIRIDDGDARYTNRFVRSEDFRVARTEGRVRRSLPGTPADGSGLGRLYRALSGGFQDNPAVGVTKLDGAVYAVTESPIGIEIDPDTLVTAGLDCDATLGHTHIEAGVQWGLGVSFGRRSGYTLFRRAGGDDPEPVSRLVFGSHPPYIHAFGLTERYAVVPAASFGVDFPRLLRGVARGDTFVDAFAPRDAPAQFHVLDRTTGERVAAIRADPFFVYHIANTYEDDGGDHLVVDCVAFDDERAITGLTLSGLRADSPDVPRGDFVRYRLPLDGGHAEREPIRYGPVEFPTIHYARYNGRPYRYVYLAATDRGSLPTAVVKIDLHERTTRRWDAPGIHPGEPLFVPAPDPAAEDDGVLMSLALDGHGERSTLVCLDATTLAERARAVLPHRVPFGFHGQFYGTTDDGRSMA